MGRPKFIAISPGRAEQKHVNGMGKAVLLHDFFVNWQTDRDGRVFYGKPISYAWIQANFFGGRRRTLQRWTARLQSHGYIAMKRTRDGFTVRILKQKKWKDKAVENAVEKERKTA